MTKEVLERGVTLVGGGAVAIDRIVPALVAHGVAPERICVIALRLAPHWSSRFPTLDARETSYAREIEAMIAGLARPLIVATPPNAHLAYTEFAIALGLPAAIEKPLCRHPNDVERFAEVLRRRDARPPLFCFGYYALEKAIALHGLVAPSFRPTAVPSLTIDAGNGARAASAEQFEELRERLGALTALDIWILESDKRSPAGPCRHWTEDPEEGGVCFDTFVHVLQLALLVLGETTSLDGLRWREGWHEARVRGLGMSFHEVAPHRIEASGYAGSVHVNLLAGKFTPPRECLRSARVEFENGVAICDFDLRRTIVEFRNGARTTIAPRADDTLASIHYATQIDLMLRAWSHPGAVEDGRAAQLAALSHLSQARSAERFTY